MIIFCHCQNAKLIPQTTLAKTADALKNSQQPVMQVDDLCALAARQDPLLKQWAEQKQLLICACYPRAVKALFHHAGVNLSETAKTVNLRTENPQDVRKKLTCDNQSCKEDDSSSHVQATNPDWVPWFPIIDYHRCKNCKQCLNFCLFGVYALSQDGTVQVARPDKCKTGCPACARVCPHAAVIFPKYDKTPINGDVVVEADWEKRHAESAASLKKRLASGSVYQILHNRKNSAGSPQSLSDLQKLRDDLDIPDELFEPHS